MSRSDCEELKVGLDFLEGWHIAWAPEFVAACKADELCKQRVINETNHGPWPEWWDMDTLLEEKTGTAPVNEDKSLGATPS